MLLSEVSHELCQHGPQQANSSAAGQGCLIKSGHAVPLDAPPSPISRLVALLFGGGGSSVSHFQERVPEELSWDAPGTCRAFAQGAGSCLQSRACGEAIGAQKEGKALGLKSKDTAQ